MKLRDKSLQEIIDGYLWWSDFEEDPNDFEQMRKAIQEDEQAADKISFLSQQEEGSLLDRSSFRKLDFYEVDFTELARLAIAGGQYLAGGAPVDRAVDYMADYSDLKLLIQDMGDIFALYLKDYSFGYIKPLGMCVYEYPLSAELVELDESKRADFIKESILLCIENDLWEEDFDLKGELYGYYHDIPDMSSPLIEQKMNFDGLLSVKEVADMLDVSAARVKKMCADKLLDGYKFHGKLLISQSSVKRRIEYIEEHGLPTRKKDKPNRAEKYREETRNRSRNALINSTRRLDMTTLEPLPNEKNWDYIERLFTYLFENGLISSTEMVKLQSDEGSDYRLANFGFSRPLFVESPQKCLDGNSYRRYYAKPIYKRYHLCKEWYFDEEHSSYNLDKLLKWTRRIISEAV
ncbi:MAG: helix-turn-helix domain-containing protein [Adlercreutzia sp.]|nr:helix-turn-helix domain-containing protein [Adlercreutzia sp.]